MGEGERRRRATAVLVAALVAGTLVTATVALGGWKAPRTLSAAGEDGQNPSVATGPDGTTIIAWTRFDGTMPPNTCCRLVQAVIRRPGGKLGAVRTLSAAGQNAGNVRVAAGPGGTVAVIFTRFDGTDPPFTCCNIAQVRILKPGAGWGPVQSLSAGGEDARDVDIGLGRKGRAVAIWTREEGPQHDRRLQARFRPATGGAVPSFGALQELSPPNEDALAPQLGTALNGYAAVVWQRYDGNNDLTVVKLRRPGKRFGARRNLSRTGDESDYHTVAVAPDGTTLAAWLVETGGLEYELEVRRRAAAGGRFGRTVKLTSASSSGEPAVALDAAGRATVAWDQLASPESRMAVRTARRGLNFGQRRFLTSAGATVQSPVIAASPDGTTVFGWTLFIEDGQFCCSLAQARVRRPDRRRFGGTKTLSIGGASASNLVVEARDRARATAVWDRFDGSDDRIQATFYKR